MLPGHSEYQAFLRPENRERPVGVEPTLPPWQGSSLPLHHGRLVGCRVVKDQEHRVGVEPTSPRYDGGILPLDDQCFSLVGPQGLEP